MGRQNSLPTHSAAPRTGGVYTLHDASRWSDSALVSALLNGDERAATLFFDRFAGHVERILTRVFGSSVDVAALVNETFFRALERIGSVEDPTGIKPWLTSIAVFVAREQIRARRRRRWLHFFAHDEVPDAEAPVGTPEMVDAVSRLYGVLDAMPADERIAFAFRFIEGMELTEVATACGVSLATVKRLLTRAEAHFAARGRRDPVLREWLEGGARWGRR